MKAFLDCLFEFSCCSLLLLTYWAVENVKKYSISVEWYFFLDTRKYIHRKAIEHSVLIAWFDGADSAVLCNDWLHRFGNVYKRGHHTGEGIWNQGKSNKKTSVSNKQNHFSTQGDNLTCIHSGLTCYIFNSLKPLEIVDTTLK